MKALFHEEFPIIASCADPEGGQGSWTSVKNHKAVEFLSNTGPKFPKITKLISNSYTMGCPPARGDNPRALASGLSYVQVDNYGITILYHLQQCRPCTSQESSC